MLVENDGTGGPVNWIAKVRQKVQRQVQQINPPKTPAWRDPARLRAEARRQRLRPILFLLTLIDLLLLLVPPEGAYDEAISFQLARGAPTAWALFVGMGVTLSYVAYRLWGWENRVWSVAASFVIFGLGVIAVTNPYSGTHNGTFITMTGFILLGHVGFFLGHLDFRLLPTSIATAAAVYLCFDHLGIGERLLIASSLGALNVLVYGHLDP